MLLRLEKVWWIGGIAFLAWRFDLAHGPVIYVAIWGFPLIGLIAYVARKLKA